MTPSTSRTALRFSALMAALAVHCGSGERDPAGFPARKDSSYDFIIVGSGAGGGPLAARLARAGKRVLLLEAGTDVGAKTPYRVPAMHAFSTEDPEMAWWYFVKHHTDESVEASDSKHTPEGVLYPRGSALGGSTAVNAMVTVLPSLSDWNRLAELTGERSFRADAMGRYEARVREWLSVEIPDPNLGLADRTVTGFLTAAAAAQSADEKTGNDGSTLAALLGHDVNEGLRRGETTGLFRLPLATKDGERNGPRELLLRTVAEGFPLTIQTGTFVTRVLWRDGTKVPTAAGVEVVRKSNVYGARIGEGAAPNADDFERQQIVTSGEVILAAGTFNTPQILALSGIGDRAALDQLDISVELDRPAVGKNLQDRYEAAVISEIDAPLDVVAPCHLGADSTNDPCLAEWEHGQGVYRTPGFLASVLRRSTPDETLADLQVFAAPTDARGYFPGYAAASAKTKNRFSWLLLKAHTKNHDGTVELASANPFARPNIHFHYFDEQNPLADPDLRALVSGVKFVRDIGGRARKLLGDRTITEVWPGTQATTDDEVARFVRKESWGHHACCTSKMGRADDASAVVDPRFRVIGADRLRVVDASVFPEIPGTFIAMPTYMLAERAADVILEDAR